MTFWGDLAARAACDGLALCGALRPGPDDDAPEGARAVALLGYGGPALWAAFSVSAEYADGATHPLDRWSARVIAAIADEVEAEALFPFGGPPHWPFARWAGRAEAAWPSPLGMIVHARRGLWSSYRGALAFSRRVPPLARPDAPRPCDSCAARPCLSACPVGAFGPTGYDVDACAAHLRCGAGGVCLSGGCLARRACPVGADRRHGPEQAQFLMRAFLDARPS